MITKFKIFEKISSEEMDEILDKISKSGMDSLSRKEKEILGATDPNFNYKEQLIQSIKSIVNEKYDGYVTTGEIYAETSPVYKDFGHEMHLIEAFFPNYVTVVIYSGYKLENETGEYGVPYEKLEEETLEEIENLLTNGEPPKFENI